MIRLVFSDANQKNSEKPSLKLTASLHLEMDGWNTVVTSFLFGLPIFRCELLVSGRVYLDAFRHTIDYIKRVHLVH